MSVEYLNTRKSRRGQRTRQGQCLLAAEKSSWSTHNKANTTVFAGMTLNHFSTSQNINFLDPLIVDPANGQFDHLTHQKPKKDETMPPSE